MGCKNDNVSFHHRSWNFVLFDKLMGCIHKCTKIVCWFLVKQVR